MRPHRRKVPPRRATEPGCGGSAGPRPGVTDASDSIQSPRRLRTSTAPVWSKCSCGLSVVEPQQPSEAFPGADLTRGLADPVHRRRKQDPIAFPLVVSLGVEMLGVVPQHVLEGLSPNKISFDRHSSFTDRFHRSRCAFRFGLHGGKVSTWMPAASRFPSKAARNFASRPCSRYRHPPRRPRSTKVALRAISAARYSLRRRSSWLTEPVTQASSRFQFIEAKRTSAQAAVQSPDGLTSRCRLARSSALTLRAQVRQGGCPAPL